MSNIIRVFLSVDIDDEGLLKEIESLQSDLDLQSAKMKLVERENIHFTWRFFGDTPSERVDAIHSELGNLEMEPFDITIGGVGAFPSTRRPRVIWVGVTQNHQLMKDLKTRTDSLLANLGYKIESKKFIPHATIARVRTIHDRDGIVDNLQRLSDRIVGKMKVNSLRMTKSTLTPTGPIYETLWEISDK